MGQTIIDINGTLYDARTGQPLPNTPAQQNHAHSPTGSIDGIVSPNAIHPTPKQPPVHHRHSAAPHQASQPSRMIQDIGVAPRQKPQRSRTLMRHAVRKPSKSNITSPDRVAPASAPQTHAASQHHKHPAVHRYHQPSQQNVASTPTYTAMAVSPHPSTSTKTDAAPPLTAPSLHHQSPVNQASPAERFVNEQLAQADHVQPSPAAKKPLRKRLFHKLRRRKGASAMAIVLAAAVFASLLAYYHTPSISLAVASRKSGISMRIPEGIPSSFALDKRIYHSPGQITVTFRSRNDDRRFDITKQRDTEQTTVAEMKNYIDDKTSGNYQTYESNGITLFIIGPGQADWLDGSMRYSITGESGLSSEQLARIAASL